MSKLTIDWTDVKTNLDGDYIVFDVTPQTTIGEINEALYETIAEHDMVITPQWDEFEIYAFMVQSAEIGGGRAAQLNHNQQGQSQNTE